MDSAIKRACILFITQLRPPDDSWEVTNVKFATRSWLHGSMYKQNNCNITWSEFGGNKDVDTLDESVYVPPDQQKYQLTLLLNAAHSFKVESCRHYTRQLVNTGCGLKRNDTTLNKRALTDSNSSQTLVLNFLHVPAYQRKFSQLQTRKPLFGHL